MCGSPSCSSQVVTKTSRGILWKRVSGRLEERHVRGGSAPDRWHPESLLVDKHLLNSYMRQALRAQELPR